MFARKVAARLKPASLAKFTKVMESEVVPWLREQEGFLHLIILSSPDGREVATISFWDHPASAEIYHANAYPEALKILEELLDGAPYVKTFEVVSSTFQTLGSGRSSHFQNVLEDRCPGPFGYSSCETGPDRLP